MIHFPVGPLPNLPDERVLFQERVKWKLLILGDCIHYF